MDHTHLSFIEIYFWGSLFFLAVYVLYWSISLIGTFIMWSWDWINDADERPIWCQHWIPGLSTTSRRLRKEQVELFGAWPWLLIFFWIPTVIYWIGYGIMYAIRWAVRTNKKLDKLSK